MKDTELAEKLIELIGPTLVSFAGGSTSDHSAEMWCVGTIAMPSVVRQRLELALECLETIEQSETQDIARAWFIGANTGSELTSPAEALREGQLDDVRISMKRLLDHELMGK